MTQTVRPLRDVVLFQFLDDTAGYKGRFEDRALASGILIAATADRQKVHRWGVVHSVGPKAALDLKPGDYILIEALMWMEGVKLEDGTRVWKTDPSKVLVVTDDVNETHWQ